MSWAALAQRIVHGLDVQPDELIQIRDNVVHSELLLAVELHGATPLPELTPPDYMERLWRGATLSVNGRMLVVEGRLTIDNEP